MDHLLKRELSRVWRDAEWLTSLLAGSLDRYGSCTLSSRNKS